MYSQGHLGHDMNDSIIPAMPPSAAPAPSASAGMCAYCGAPLHGAVYFCLVCASPYQHPDKVVPAARPLELSEGQLVRKKAPQVWTLFFTYMGVLIASAILGLLIFGKDQEGMQMLLGSVLLFITTLVFGGMYWKSLAVQLKRIGFLRWETYAALGALAPLLGINYLYHGWLRGLIGEDDPMSKLTQEIGLPAMIVLICVLPAVLEEIAFRGLVQHWLQTALRPWRAVILASALFAALHFSIVSAPYLFAVGMLLGWTKWKTGSLYPCMLIHFLHNFAVVAFLA